MPHYSASSGPRIFLTVWFGQLVSLIGSTLTSFALGVWVYQRTGSTTQYALISLFVVLPSIAISPLIGVIVDRLDRRHVMLLSDSGAACGTLFIAVLLLVGQLHIGYIYIAVFLSALFSAFQYPAYMASITLLIPKQHYARASGLVDLAGVLGYLVAPTLGGFLLVNIRLQGVLLIDFATFLVSLLTLSIVRFPRLVRADNEPGAGQFWRESLYGWSYIRARQGLLALLIFFAVANFFNGLVSVLMIPMILAFASTETLGVIGSISASGFLVGGVVVSIWGGPKRPVTGILAFGALSGVAIVFAGSYPSLLLVSVSLWALFFCSVVVDACSQAIWQCKVDPRVQGRVFAFRSMITQLALPLAFLTAGPLTDYAFEPLLGPNGVLNGTVGRIIGVGAGRGIGLSFILFGVLLTIVVAAAGLYAPLRRIEEELPDHDFSESTTRPRQSLGPTLIDVLPHDPIT